MRGRALPLVGTAAGRLARVVRSTGGSVTDEAVITPFMEPEWPTGPGFVRVEFVDALGRPGFLAASEWRRRRPGAATVNASSYGPVASYESEVAEWVRSGAPPRARPWASNGDVGRFYDLRASTPRDVLRALEVTLGVVPEGPRPRSGPGGVLALTSVGGPLDPDVDDLARVLLALEAVADGAPPEWAALRALG